MKLHRIFSDLARYILGAGVKRATKFFSPKLTLKATRRGRPDRRDKSVEMLFTIGRPNYAERQYIKRLLKAGEPFPVRKVLLKNYLTRKSA